MAKKRKQNKNTSKNKQVVAKQKPHNKSNKNASQLAKEHARYEAERLRAAKQNNKAQTIPMKMSREEFEFAKSEYEPMVTEANHRIEMIQAAGYTSYALDRVLTEGGKDYFDLDSINNREELIRDITRMRVFINDIGSTLDGAKLESAQISAAEYAGKFGNEYNNDANNHAKYDISVIDKDIASRAFESYRILEETRASEIGVKGASGVYGSDNLIHALYDAEVRGLNSQMYGKDLLDTFVKTKKAEWQEANESANMVTAISGKIENDNITRGLLF